MVQVLVPVDELVEFFESHQQPVIVGQGGGRLSGIANVDQPIGPTEGGRLPDRVGVYLVQSKQGQNRLPGVVDRLENLLVWRAEEVLGDEVTVGILLVEEVGERPYRIDRCFSQLRAAGKLERLVGVAVGALVECGDPRYPEADAREVVLEAVADLGVPVVATAARQKRGLGLLNQAIYEVATGKARCKPLRVGAGAQQIQRAAREIAENVSRLYPGLPNADWVALRLLDGDERITQAFRDRYYDIVKRTLVEKVDFISAAGSNAPNVYRPGGPHALVTNRCLFMFDKARGRFRLESIHPGESVESIRDNTGTNTSG